MSSDDEAQHRLRHQAGEDRALGAAGLRRAAFRGRAPAAMRLSPAQGPHAAPAGNAARAVPRLPRAQRRRHGRQILALPALRAEAALHAQAAREGPAHQAATPILPSRPSSTPRTRRSKCSSSTPPRAPPSTRRAGRRRTGCVPPLPRLHRDGRSPERTDTYSNRHARARCD